jgi:NAD(P)H-hydrate epimerase
MTEPLTDVMEQAERRSLVAIGPGLGTSDETSAMVRRAFAEIRKPMVVDADALNCLAGTDWKAGEFLRVLTPHPGEMSRLTGKTIAEVQADRVGTARGLATERHVTVVLKGDGTLIAFPDGRVWINPTGSPAMSTGGTGDILTGLVAGLLAQFPHDADRAVAGAVYLHGLAGEIAARHLTEQPVIATDLLKYLPEAVREIRL